MEYKITKGPELIQLEASLFQPSSTRPQVRFELEPVATGPGALKIKKVIKSFLITAVERESGHEDRWILHSVEAEVRMKAYYNSTAKTGSLYLENT